MLYNDIIDVKDYRNRSLPNKVEGVLFDFDGTLIDMVPKWWTPMENAFIRITGSVPEKKLISKITEIFANIPTNQTRLFLLKVMYTIGRKGGLGRLNSLRFIKQSSNEFKKSRYINIPFEGVPELIEGIQIQGIKVGIVSSASKKELDKAVEELPFMRGLPIVSRNDVNELKPNAEPILIGLLKIDTQPKNTLYVGDFHTDIIAGKAANTMTCAIIGDFPEISKNGLEGYDPDIIINKTSELMDFLIV